MARPYGTTPGRIHFLIRRLHSLTGLVFGGYIFVHLTVNATGLWPATYQANVEHIHAMEPMLPLIELVAIFIPLLIHALYGIYITWAGVKFNTMKYNYGGNLRYSLQRWTAVILLLFIAFHVGTLHRWGLAGIAHLINLAHPAADSFFGHIAAWCSTWGGLFNPEQAYETTVLGVRKMFFDPEHPGDVGICNALVMGFYLLGVWSACFHFANGLWTSAIAWGLTVSDTAQRRWGHVCFAFFILIMIIGTTAWAAFTVVTKG